MGIMRPLTAADRDLTRDGCYRGGCRMKTGPTPGILKALIPRRMQGHSSTEEVPAGWLRNAR